MYVHMPTKDIDFEVKNEQYDELRRMDNLYIPKKWL